MQIVARWYAIFPDMLHLAHIAYQTARWWGDTVYTIRNISVAYRGYGVQETAFAYESHMDEIAHRLKMDPVQLRLKNALRVGDAGSTGQIIDCGGLVECIELVAKEMDWDGFDQRVRRVEECNGRKIYAGTWYCCHTKGPEMARGIAHTFG